MLLTGGLAVKDVLVRWIIKGVEWIGIKSVQHLGSFQKTNMEACVKSKEKGGEATNGHFILRGKGRRGAEHLGGRWHFTMLYTQRPVSACQ